MCLKDLKGHWLILYFYPKDSTGVFIREALDFSESLKDFEKMNAVILGVSPDSTKSHTNFAAKHNLKITLLSDP